MSDNFQTGSPTHLVTVGICAALTALAAWLTLRWRSTPRADLLRRTVGYGCLATWLLTVCYPWLAGDFAWRYSLPLQFCNLANLIGGLAILTRWRLFQSLLYFWGLALCLWPFVTPTLWEGPGSLVFWLFWGYHVFILLATVELLVGQRFRPEWRDWRRATAATLAYTALLAAVNARFGWNYGFVGSARPSAPTLLNVLGPYPFRVLWMVLLGVGVFALLVLPWYLGRTSSPGDHEDAPNL